LLLLYKPLHLEAQQVSTRIEVRRHQLPAARLPAPPRLQSWHGPPSSNSLSDDGNFIKCLFPLGPASPRYMLSLLPRILSWGRLLPADWWSPGVAGIMPVPCFYRSCRGQAAFGEAAIAGASSSSSTLALLGGVVSRFWRSRSFGRSWSS
jgi:hypothetical protein